jgi:ferrochelatase
MAARLGILLGQLGTPAAPTAPAVRRYLRQFLGDPRVLEMNALGRWLLLNLIVLPRRPPRSAELYRRIWTAEGSPLLINTRAQAEGVSRALGPGVRVEIGMRYGNPSLGSAIGRMASEGIDRLLLFPLYPQYSAPTTASTLDETFRALAGLRAVPALRVVPPFYAHPAYVDSVAQVAREFVAGLAWRPDKVLLSFHGVPRRYVESGDPYRSHCEESARRIASALGLASGEWVLTFQSRFGREEWLRPYTDETLKALGRSGVRRLAVLCPGFISDCLETIDEIGSLGLEQFRSTGGEELALVPCLNAHPAWIAGMAHLAREELCGWLE